MDLVGYDTRQKGGAMSYKKLPESTKNIISKNSNDYNKTNYKQVKFTVRPEIADKFEALCKEAGVSKAEMFRRFVSSHL